ncbi:MAG: 4Fe-4S dicluster domain-containing protein [Desulfomonilaceae bacterium]
MQTYVVSHQDWNLFLGRVMEDWAVVGPRQRPDQPGFYYFDHVKDPQDLALDYTTTTIPPKNAFSPPTETLFNFAESNPPGIDLVRDTTPFLLVGVHPCDLAAIDALDAAYSYPPAEMRWAEQRKRATIIGIDCLPDEYCFCASIGTSESRKTCDLFLTPIDGAYFIEVHTAAGEKMLKTVPKVPTQARHLEEVERWHSEKVARTTASLDSPIANFADILDRGGLAPVWQEVASRCYSCGSCNTTCPTCFCFSMDDEFDLTFTGGVRRRSWDSCQLLDFALVAGGHNFRGERWQRVRHRWHRKFLYLYRRLGRPYCTGCGRCSRACTADINIVDVSNQLISYSQNGGHNV